MQASHDSHTRNAFFQGMAKTVVAERHASYLASHLKAATIESIEKELAAKVYTEIRKVGDHLSKLVSGFPTFEVEFPKIESALQNLSSIENSFRTVDSDATDIARTAIEDATRAILLKRHHEATRSPILDIDALVRNIILLKKASREILTWCHHINRTIDESLQRSPNGSEGASRFLLDLVVALTSVEGDSTALSRQILAEHKRLEGATNATFNDATARQDIDYFISKLSLPSMHTAHLKASFETFEATYQDIVAASLSYLQDSSKVSDRLEEFVQVARAIGQNFSADYSTQVVHILAHVFAYWSLVNSNAFVTSSSCQGYEEVSQDLMKPHAAQFVAIWMLLNCCESK